MRFRTRAVRFRTLVGESGQAKAKTGLPPRELPTMKAGVTMKIFRTTLSLWCCGILISGCGSSMQNGCTITANVAPASATADHTLAPPGNQVQFTAQSSAVGNCPLAPDTLGTWSTSDTTNTSINQQGLATCLNATTTPATISNSGMVRSIKAFTPATLTCH